MKKLILTIFFLLSTTAFAEVEKYNFYWNQLPAVCAEKEEIHRWAKDKNFTPINMSYGRTNGRKDGEILYIVVYWLNDKGETFASVQTPNDNNVCIVFRTFDLIVNPNIGNPSFNL